MYLSCLAFLGYILFAHRRVPLPFGYLPLCALALLTAGGFAAALAGHFAAYRTGAEFLGLILLAAAGGAWLFRRARDRRKPGSRSRSGGKTGADRAGPAPAPAGNAAEAEAGNAELRARRDERGGAMSRADGEDCTTGRPAVAAGNGHKTIAGGGPDVEPILFSGALLALPWYFHGVALRYYDEFFWGNLLKALLLDSRPLTAASPLGGTGIPLLNPPGPALLQSLFMPGGFDEAGMAVGGMALVLALGSLVLHLARPVLGLGRALLLALLCACLARCTGTLHEGVYLVGYTEYLQGSVFATLLAVAVFEPDARRRNAVLLPGLALLALIKATGFLFALGVAAVAASTAAGPPPTPLPDAARSSAGRRPRLRAAFRCLGTALLLLLPVLLAKLLWDWHVHFQLRPETGDIAARIAADAPRTLAKLGADALSATAALPDVSSPAGTAASAAPPAPGSTAFYRETLAALARAFYGRPLLLSPLLPESAMSVLTSTFSLLLQGAAALWLLARRAAVRPTPAQGRALALLTAGLAGWIAVRWLVSVQAHTPAEALRAASYERYIGAYMAGCLVLFTLIFHTRLAASPGRAARLSPPLLAGQTLLTLILCGALPPWPRPADVPPGPVREDMEQAAALLAARTPPGSRIWFIEQNTDNRKTWALRYLAAPDRLVGLPADTWSLGAPYDAQDRYSRPLPPEALRGLARDNRIDYLLLWKYDRRFLEQYGPALGLDDLRGGVLLDAGEWREGRAATPRPVGAAPQEPPRPPRDLPKPRP